MTWIKLDDQCADHPKVVGLSDRAFRTWVTAMCYASRFLTDGVLPSAFLKRVPPKVRSELVGAGLWDASGAQVRIHDYLVHQNSREYVNGEREFDARRAAMRRDPKLRAAIQARDGDSCRYCGRKVSWSDRRSESGATYDHVVPSGPETLENLVVACRRCNTTKGQRTPEQAGMALLQIQSTPRSELETLKRGPIPEYRGQIQRTETDPEGTTKNVVPRVGGGGLLMSPAQFAKARQSHAYVGERLSVPHVLHDELRRKLGGDDPEAALRAWYAGLDAELLATKEPVPDVFAFVRPKFADWAQGQANEREMARFLAGEV